MVLNIFGKDKGKKKEESAHPTYYDLKVKEVVNETSDAITIVFEQPEEEITYESGQFLTLISEIDGKEVRRAYSLCSSPYLNEDLAVTVKRVEEGVMSNFLNDTVQAGQSIRVMQPMGNFTTVYDGSNKRHLLMFGGGSGITPLMSIAKSMLHQEPESIVTLIFANRNIDSIIFKEKLDALQQNYEGRFRVIHILDSAPMNWQGPSGLLNREMLEKLFERLPDWGIENSKYIMCGPEGMMNNVQTLLEERDIPTDRIFRESFVAGIMNKPAEEEVGEEIKTQTVTVLYDGEEHVFDVEPDSSILETALDNDIDLPFSCQSGLCTACRCRLVSGKIKMDEDEGLSESEKEQGYVLICVGHPLTGDVKLEVG